MPLRSTSAASSYCPRLKRAWPHRKYAGAYVGLISMLAELSASASLWRPSRDRSVALRTWVSARSSLLKFSCRPAAWRAMIWLYWDAISSHMKLDIIVFDVGAAASISVTASLLSCCRALSVFPRGLGLFPSNSRRPCRAQRLGLYLPLELRMDSKHVQPGAV